MWLADQAGEYCRGALMLLGSAKSWRVNGTSEDFGKIILVLALAMAVVLISSFIWIVIRKIRAHSGRRRGIFVGELAVGFAGILALAWLVVGMLKQPESVAVNSEFFMVESYWTDRRISLSEISSVRIGLETEGLLGDIKRNSKRNVAIIFDLSDGTSCSIEVLGKREEALAIAREVVDEITRAQRE